MKQIAWDEVMKRLEVASKICNDASPVQVEGPIHVGVDLGTADVVVMAVDDNGMPVSAFLEWATVVRDGVVVDYHGAITIVKRLVSMTEERLGRKITEASTSYPPGTDARLSTNILDAANLRLVSTADEPSCLARLARLDRAAVVDIGGGTSEVALISMTGIAVSQSVRVAGDAMNLAVQHYLREVFRLEVGENTAENVKKILGAALPQNNSLRLEVSGKDLVYGGPRVVTVTEGDICEALHDPVQAVVETVLRALEQAPPALAADVYDNGLLMAGGGALLRGLDQCIARATHLKVAVDKDPLTTVLRGTAQAMLYREDYEGIFIN